MVDFKFHNGYTCMNTDYQSENVPENDKKYLKRNEENKMISTKGQTGNFGTIRKTLCGSRTRQKKLIDMEWVYKELDKGRTRQEVADELGVCVSTLNKRHKKYQRQLEVLNSQEDGMSIGTLPPIPDEYRI